jgi:hypothetical protein
MLLSQAILTSKRRQLGEMSIGLAIACPHGYLYNPNSWILFRRRRMISGTPASWSRCADEWTPNVSIDDRFLLLCGSDDYSAQTLAGQVTDPAGALEGAPASSLSILLAHTRCITPPRCGIPCRNNRPHARGQYYPWICLFDYTTVYRRSPPSQ